MRLVVFSDLHLDAPFSWAQPPVARARRHALRTVLRGIVALADEVGADALLCAGDLYEHERVTPDTAAFVRDAFGEAPCPVLLAPGNHDWYGPASLYARTEWPDHVTVFTDDRLSPHELADGLTIWGAAHRAPANTADFLDGFEAKGEGLHLGLFHGSERAGLARESGGKAPHAPFDAEQIPAAGLAHAFVGHHHRPRDAATHTYPGNPEPLTFGEQGERGPVIADVAGDGRVTRQRRRVAVTDWHDVACDVTGSGTADDVRERMAAALDGRHGVARVSLTGELGPDVDVRDADLVAGPAGGLEAVVVRWDDVRVAYDLDAVATEPTVRGQFVRDVLAADDLDAAERERVLVAGLRALDGRDDLAVA